MDEIYPGNTRNNKGTYLLFYSPPPQHPHPFIKNISNSYRKLL